MKWDAPSTEATRPTKNSFASLRDNKYCLFAFSLVSTALAAGNALGWPALRSRLFIQQEHTKLSETQLSQIYTAGTWSLYGCRLLYGVLRDRCWGTRTTCSVGLLLAAWGSLGLALSDTNDAIALSISMAFVGLGGGVQLCVQPIAGLFPESQGIVLSSITGAFSVSIAVFLVLTSIITMDVGGMDRKSVFIGFTMVQLLLMMCAIILLPKGQFVKEKLTTVDVEETEKEDIPPMESTTKPTDEDYEKDEQVLNSENDDNPVTAAKCTERGNLEFESDLENESFHSEFIEETPQNGEVNERPYTSLLHDLSLKEMIKSFEYIGLLVYFSITLTALNYYIGTIGYQLEQKGDDTGQYTDTFIILNASVAVLSPLPGKISDLYGIGVLQGVALVALSISFFVLASNASLEVGQVIGLTIHALARLAALSSFFINVARRFGYKYYGTLVGGGLLICATFSLVQAPLLRLAATGKEVAVNLSLGAAMLSLVPYCVWLRVVREQPERARK